MELPEYDIPKSIFLYLFMEDTSFSLSYTEPVAILLYKLGPIPFSDPVTKIIPEHSTDDGWDYRPDDMSLTPESSYEDHDIHAWYCCSDDRKWLDASREKCYEIIPRSESFDQLTDPLYTNFDPLRLYERDNNQDKRKESEKNRKEFSEGFDDIFEYMFHSFRI